MSSPELISTGLERAPCPLCNVDGHDVAVLQGGDRLHGKPGMFYVVRCQGCGLMRTNPRPGPDAIAFYYPADYGPFHQTVVKSATADVAPRVGLSRVRQVLKRLVPPPGMDVPPVAPGRMLEIGCASGAFLHHMAGRGWDVEGVEPDPDAAARAAALGYSVQSCRIEDAPAPDTPYDLIVGWMVLEHVHQPVEALRLLRTWTRPGGCLAISVPDAGSIGFRVCRDRWFALQLPTHLTHFTRSTVRRTLERAGWKVERIISQPNANNLWKSLRYYCDDYGLVRCGRFLDGIIAGGHLPLVLLDRLAGRALGALRASGRMTVWARRVDD